MMPATVRPVDVLGIDPGQKHIGYAVLAVSNGRATRLFSGMMPLDDRAWRDAVRSWRPGLIVIERPIWQGRPEAGGPLLETMRVAGMWAGIALAHALPTLELPCRDWRKVLCGKGAANDRAVKVAIHRFVREWPTVSKNHERDAAGVALVGAWMGPKKPSTWPRR